MFAEVRGLFLLVPACAFLVTLLAIGPGPMPEASAFVRTMTCTPPGEPGSALPCRDGEEPLGLYWDAPCVGYHVHEDGLAELGAKETRRIVHNAFATWDRVDCSWLRMVPLGLTNETRIGYDPCGGRNANVVVFREDSWTAMPGSPVIALTSVTYITRTGQILDADIEVNAADFRVGEVDNLLLDRNVVDLQNALTHEIGHLLGLDHTRADEHFVGDPDEYQDATMHALTRPGEVRKRTLAEDDIAGVCSIYPAEVGHPDGECTLSEERSHRAHNARSRDYPTQCTTGGCRNCSVGSAGNGASGGDGAPGAPGAPGALLVLFALLALRRRGAGTRGW